MASENKSVPPKPQSPASSSSSPPPPPLPNHASSSSSPLPPPPPPPNHRNFCKQSTYCGSTEFMLQNHSNFNHSAAPTRLMYYATGSWLDFSSETLEIARLGFIQRKPMIEIAIEGLDYIFDFISMLQIDTVDGKHRSIAWIDEKGKCFFPKMFASYEVSEYPEEIEIDVRIEEDEDELAEQEPEL